MATFYLTFFADTELQGNSGNYKGRKFIERQHEGEEGSEKTKNTM